MAIRTDHMLISDTVAAALQRRRPVVALETTLVSHGLPRPEGVRIALELEQTVRAGGAVPATIGVLEGSVRVGMTAAEIEQLATTKSVAKVNLSNLAAQLSNGPAGSTTVAATVFLAARVGINVFATGGIGGVHRNVGESGDVSSDMVALSRWPVAVVCAGAKAILDLPKTVEMLETLGVPVLGLQTSEFPAFYRRSTGIPVDYRYDDVASLAVAVNEHFSLRLGTGVVVVNPIPAEHELPRELYDRALASALAAATAAGVQGRAVTPFLLERMRELTEGESVFSNRALLVNNARAAAELAVAMTGG